MVVAQLDEKNVLSTCPSRIEDIENYIAWVRAKRAIAASVLG